MSGKPVASRGLVLLAADLDYRPWPALLQDSGINLLGLHCCTFTSDQQGVVDDAANRGIDIEYVLHLAGLFMTPELFVAHPDWFAMDVLGQRDVGGNPCTGTPGMLEYAAQQSAKWAKKLPTTSHRYRFYARDNRGWCHCEQCMRYAASDQNLLLAHAFLEGVRSVDPAATMAYAAYLETLPPPEAVRPREGVFLEYAPYRRLFTRALDDPGCHANAFHLQALDRLLQVFPAATASVLEYWLDISYWSNYRRPARPSGFPFEELPRDINAYVSRGIDSISSFACYMDSEFLASFGTDLISYFGRSLLRQVPQRS